MKAIHDQAFLKTLLDEFRGGRTKLTALLAHHHIEVADYGPQLGFQIDVCDRRDSIIILGWIPSVRDTAFVIGGLDKERIDVDRLTTVVRQFLETHGYWTTADEERCVVFRVIHELGRAIQSKDWSTARRAWTRLSPLYPTLFARNPSLAYVGEVLANEEALVQAAERQSNSTH